MQEYVITLSLCEENQAQLEELTALWNKASETPRTTSEEDMLEMVLSVGSRHFLADRFDLFEAMARAKLAQDSGSGA